MVVSGGVVSGTWEMKDEQVLVSWFKEEPLPLRLLEGEVRRLSRIVARPLDLRVERV